MKIIDVLKFKSETRVNWDETYKAIATEMNRLYPDEPVSTKMLATQDIFDEIQRKIKKMGIRTAYIACQKVNKERGS